VNRRRPRWLLAGLTALVSVVLIEGSAQVLFRLKMGSSPASVSALRRPPEQRRYIEDHPYLPYFPRPGREEKVEFNVFGGRGPDPGPKTLKKRVVCLGGSTTFDAAHERSKTWPGMLQELLGPEWEVVNAAQNGATSADSLISLALLQVELKPDYVLVYQGHNDLEPSYTVGFRPDYLHRRRSIRSERHPVFDTLPRWFGYSAVYTTVREAVSPTPMNLWQLYTRPNGRYDFDKGPFGLQVFRRNIRSIAAVASEHGAKTVLGTFVFHEGKAEELMDERFAKAFGRGIELHNAITREEAAASDKITLAEIANGFTPTAEHMSDWCHLSAKGNAVIARGFYEALTSQ